MSLPAAVQLAFVATAVSAALVPDAYAPMCEKLPKTGFPCDPTAPDDVTNVYETVIKGNEAAAAKVLQTRKIQYTQAVGAYNSNPTKDNLNRRNRAEELLRVTRGIWENANESKKAWKETVDCIHQHFKTPNLNYRSVKPWKAKDKRAGGGRK